MSVVFINNDVIVDFAEIVKKEWLQNYLLKISVLVILIMFLFIF